MKTKAKVILAASLLALMGGTILFLLATGAFDSSVPRLACHKAIDGALEQWKLETTNGNWFPNVEGRSLPSLSVATNYISPADSIRDYKYVPGLSSEDPQDLVLMYVKEPSRHSWHGDTRWFQPKKRWIVLNPRSHQGEGDKWSEIAEWIPTEEFTNRLIKTLTFLAEMKRPYWTNAVKEHSEFLQSLQK